VKLGLVALVLVACTSADPNDAAVCMQIEQGCPTTPPSYAGDVAPIVQARCVGCHFPGTTIAPSDLSSYAQLRPRAGTALGQVQSCNMPPPDAGVLSVDERTTFVEWLRCGAPND
jgi:cytochrome c5